MSASCLVVGAGPGIGRAVSAAFAREGFDIAMASPNPVRLQPFCEEIRRASGRRAEAFEADTSDETSLQRLFSEVRERVGAPGVVVFNAAGAHRGRPTELSTEQWLHDFRSNVVAAAVCARLAAPAMRSAGTGSILLTGGGFALEPSAAFASLSADKAALRSLAHTLSQELGGDGIHVATVTVYGLMQAGTHFDPARIAESFIRLHRQPRGHFEIEAVYR